MLDTMYVCSEYKLIIIKLTVEILAVGLLQHEIIVSSLIFLGPV